MKHLGRGVVDFRCAVRVFAVVDEGVEGGGVVVVGAGDGEVVDGERGCSVQCGDAGDGE